LLFDIVERFAVGECYHFCHEESSFRLEVAQGRAYRTQAVEFRKTYASLGRERNARFWCNQRERLRRLYATPLKSRREQDYGADLDLIARYLRDLYPRARHNHKCAANQRLYSRRRDPGPGVAAVVAAEVMRRRPTIAPTRGNG